MKPINFATTLQAKKALEFQELINKNEDPQLAKKQEQINSAIDFEGQIHITYEKWLCIQSKKIKEETLRRSKRFFEVFLLPHFSKYYKNREYLKYLKNHIVVVFVSKDNNSNPPKIKNLLWRQVDRLLEYCTQFFFDFIKYS